ncbi:MAG: CHASE3 domain-containing protein [Gammaproteobacteria bacterium]|nr:CHASE3 domain-containing protein [Gammaproteobacteria bacterium]
MKVRYINGLLLLGLVILSITSFLAYEQITRLKQANAWVMHTQEVINAANKTILATETAQLLILQYLLTGETNKIKQFERHVLTSKQHISILNKLTADNPAQHYKVQRLEQQMNSYLVALSQIVSHIKPVQNTALATNFRTLEKNHVQHINETLSLISQDEKRLLVERAAVSTSTSHLINLILIITGALGTLMLLYSLYFLNHHLNKRLLAERASAEIQNRLRRIIDSSNDLIAAVDNDLNYIAFNNAYEEKFKELFNQPLSLGFNLKKLLPSKRVENMILDWERSLKGEEFKIITSFDEYRKDSHYFEATYNALYDMDGHRMGGAHIMRDITERRKVDQLKNEFIAVVSHELRTPLTAIKGSLSLLLGGAIGSLDEKIKNMLQIAYNNCERLITLINDMLDIEKIESGKIEFNLQKIDLNTLIQEGISANQSYADSYNVSIESEMPSQHVYVYADHSRLIQVLNNLLSNAIKFSPTKQAIILNLSTNDHHAIVSVTDHGAGVPVTFRKQVFEKFSQANTSDVRKHGGSGLGLNISKAIIEKMGGTIHFRSQENIATTFYFSLPLISKLNMKEPPIE